MPAVLLAPDKFKGTLTGAEVAASLAEGIHSRRPGTEVIAVPVADGGDGSLAAFEAAGFERVPVTASAADGRPAHTRYARRGATAAAELAEVAGLAGLHGSLAPLTATSRGLGEVIAHALDAGCTRIVVGIGGSASTDGGLGLVQALGARARDASGADVGPGGAGAASAATLDLSNLHGKIAQARIEIACDVDNPLTGPQGAAAVYGPQKGAGPDQVRELDAALGHWADVVAAATGHDHRAEPGAGAAGGVGFGAIAVLGARLRPGAQLILDQLGFAGALARAQLVVTGEGSLDAQTLRGKAPAAVAAAARRAGVPVIGVAGRCLLDAPQLQAAGFDRVYTLLDEADTEQQALEEAATLLRRIGERLGDGLSDDL
ncbi:MAG TPA: glycerate kinase [Solirubrobacteraceae bacterium]|jgi:glycerate kinase